MDGSVDVGVSGVAAGAGAASVPKMGDMSARARKDTTGHFHQTAAPTARSRTAHSQRARLGNPALRLPDQGSILG